MRYSTDIAHAAAADAPKVSARAVAAVPRRNGFVLMEALIALAIVGVMAVALLGATSMQLRTAGKAATLLTARSLAEERMAVLRSLEYEGLSDPPDSILAGTFGEPFTDYSWRAEITPVEDEYDLFTVAVLVTAHDDEFTLRTLLHEPQPQLTAGSSGEITR